MHQFAKRIFLAAAPLLLTGCLWGPGKFASDLTLKKDGSFVLDYKGEIVLQTPPDEGDLKPWSEDEVRCMTDGKVFYEAVPPVITPERSTKPVDLPKLRPCTKAEFAKSKAEHEARTADSAKSKRKQAEQMAKTFGLPGFDDESNRAFAAKLSKYAGYRSVTYRGKGVFDVDYHLEGRATQDFLFPAMPDSDVLIPFIAMRRRADGSVLVTAPAMAGKAGLNAMRAGYAAEAGDASMASRADGKFRVITDGEILTNNSEDGAAPHQIGRQLIWDVSATSAKIPEALIRLQ